MLYESVFILSGQISPKSAEKKFSSFTEKINKSGGKILKLNLGGSDPSPIKLRRILKDIII